MSNVQIVPEKNKGAKVLSRKKSRGRRRAIAIVLLVYAELCFCGGYILAHRQQLQARKSRQAMIYAQTDNSGAQYYSKR